MKLTHLLITRFSYRPLAEAQSPSARAPQGGLFSPRTDPLEPRRLERRLRFFELFCAPAVLAQTTHAFAWIIIVDRALSALHRERLRRLTAAHPETHLVEAASRSEMATLSWYQPYIPADTTFVLTTNLDDDDLIARGLVDYMQSFIRARAAEETLPSIMAIGCKPQLQWDFYCTRRALLGYLKPWHRSARWLSPGCSLCCKYPAYDISTHALRHTTLNEYFDADAQATLPGFRAIRRSADAAGEDWRSWVPEDHVHTVELAGLQSVLVNHIDNAERTRLVEARETRKIVQGAQDLPDMPVDVDAIADAIQPLRPGDLLRASLPHARDAVISRRSLSRRRGELGRARMWLGAIGDVTWRL
jgi:hypothetical protein